MGEYTNGDIQRLHERIDELGTNLRSELAESTKQVINLCIAMGKIETHIKLLPPPASRPCRDLTEHLDNHKQIKRPCPELSEHLTSHKEIRFLWQKPLISKLIDLALLAIIAAAFFYFGHQKTEEPSKSETTTHTTTQR